MGRKAGTTSVNFLTWFAERLPEGDADRVHFDAVLRRLQVAPGAVWGPDRIAEIRALAEQGLNSVEIGRRMGCHSKTIRRLADRYALPLRRRRDPQGAVLPRVRVAALAAAGVSQAEIARRCGVERGTLRRFMEREGIEAVRAQRPFDPADIEAIHAMWADGMTARQIGDVLGRSAGVILRARRRTRER